MENKLSTKRILLIGVGLFIIFLVIGLLIVSSLKKPNGPNPNIRPLAIINILPPEDVTVTYLPIAQVEIWFNQPIKPEDLVYSINPPVNAKVRQKPDTNSVLILYTEDLWQKGITTITIQPETTAISGGKLTEPKVYKIKTDLPQNPPEDSHPTIER